MKKGLIIIAAALFVAAMVLPAMAADMSISGYYRVRGIYQSNADGGAITPFENEGSPDAWWDHHLQLNPVFKVADNLKLVTRVSVFNNQMFGSDKTSGAVTTTGASQFAQFNTETDNILFNRAYIDWATPKGTLLIGRQAAGTTFLPFANTERDGDRIRYNSPTWSGFKFTLYYEKVNENSVTSTNNIADQDKDDYSLRLNYAQPCWFLGYGLDYVRDRATSLVVATGYKADYYLHHVCLKANDPTNTYFFEGEVQLQAGDYRDYYTNTVLVDQDREGWGYYAAVGMRKGPLTVALATAFTSGDDDSAVTSDYEVGPAFGLDFQPLYIATGPYSNVLTNQSGSYGAAMAAGVAVKTGAKAYVLSADYQVDPELALHGALGAAYADKTTAGIDDEFGKELDLGLKYQIMSNLAYELHFGYLWTGDFFQLGDSAVKTDNVYQIDHSLTLSF